MALALLAGHSLEVAHVGRADGVADDPQVVDLRRFLATLASKRFFTFTTGKQVTRLNCQSSPRPFQLQLELTSWEKTSVDQAEIWKFSTGELLFW